MNTIIFLLTSIFGIIGAFYMILMIIALIFGDKYGMIIRLKSFWIGVHYSDYNKRYCINIIPCITIWWTKKHGRAPSHLLLLLPFILLSCTIKDDDNNNICPCTYVYQTSNNYETNIYDTLHYTIYKNCITDELLPNQPLPPGIIYGECIN